MSNENYGQHYQPPPVPPPLPQAPPSQRKEEGAGKYVLLIGGGCLLLLLLAGAVGFFVWYIFNATADPLKVVNLQLQALQQNDLEKAYSYCSAGFKQYTNYESFQSFVSGNPALKNAKEFTSSNREVAQGTAKLKGNLVSSDGTKSIAEFHLVQEGRAWKIQYINIGESAATSEENKSVRKVPDQNRDEIPTSTPEPQDDVAPQAQRDTINTIPAPTGGLRIQEIQVEQQADGDLTAVTIRFKVYGFGTDDTGRSPRIHLLQDLKTYYPDGSAIPDLTRPGIKDLEDYGTFDYANMWNSLKIPSSYPRGTYRVELTVHDQVGNTDTTSSTEFTLQ